MVLAVGKKSVIRLKSENFDSISWIKIFRFESDYRLFSNCQDHSLDQCKSDEKTFWDRTGVLEYNDPKWH